MPRKTQGQVEAIERLQGASMRPRPDAAENVIRGLQEHGYAMLQ